MRPTFALCLVSVFKGEPAISRSLEEVSRKGPFLSQLSFAADPTGRVLGSNHRRGVCENEEVLPIGRRRVNAIGGLLEKSVGFPGKRKKPHLNQGRLSLIQLTYKGHLCG